MAHIGLKSVSKSFGDVLVIPPLDLEIESGEFAVFVGPSGCGKSTLLRLIAGLEDVSSGIVSIDGEDATGIGPAHRGLAMVFQSYALYPHMTVRKNLSFPLKMAKLAPADIDAKVEEAAGVLNLTDYLDRRPGQLSGGQRQRVAIGRAIVREPKAFLFDEPLSNLDAALRVNMRLEIAQLHQSLKTTMIYVTHDQVEAMTMADKIVVLNGGVIEQVGSPLELYNKPVNKFVAGFIGSPKMNFLAGAHAQKFGAACIGIRPEHMSVSLESAARAGAAQDGAAQAGSDWRGTVAAREHLGSDAFFYISIEGGERLTVRESGETKVKTGDSVLIRAEVENIHRFDENARTIS